ncbi:MAG: PEP/pyruvate-binding domain-containing protein [Acidobacteriota bacterium]
MAIPEGPKPFAYDALMPFTVRKILLVASAYDSFILEEEGQFSDRLLSEYRALDLSTPPKMDHVASAEEALRRLEQNPYDLVITTPHIHDMTPHRLGAEIGRYHRGLPVVLLSYDRSDLVNASVGQGIDHAFLWVGDPRLFLAIVKLVEDHKNVDRDAREGLVRVIVLVEDSAAFYSSYLPIIYSELLDQVRSLLAQGLNDRERHYRMRARPKILLARTHEEGEGWLQRYRQNLLGVICDMRFPSAGTLDPEAGLRFIRAIRQSRPDLPVLLQSKEPDHAAVAQNLEVHYADKNSPELLGELRSFMRRNFGFGPFIFRTPAGDEVERVATIREMVEVLDGIPDEAILFHAHSGHFSNWLMARSEFGLAQEVRSRKAEDFAGAQEVRNYLQQVLTAFLEDQQRGQVTEFRRQTASSARDFTRIGTGSMGGKARGLAFVARLLADQPFREQFPTVRVTVPRTSVICTDLFEEFCAAGSLRERALDLEDDGAIAEMFLRQGLQPQLLGDLRALIEAIDYPLAVRSSSLLEDSEFQPLAGMYKTFLLPNRSGSLDRRLAQLSRAVRLIWASTFFSGPRGYMKATHQRLEEEKMAVIVERLVGRRHGDRFYPDFAGVAQSHNVYPMAAVRPGDGLATVALGLGETVVGGGQAYRFSPRHPRVSLSMVAPEDALRSGQNRFFALDLGNTDFEPQVDEGAHLLHLDLSAAEADGTLSAVASSYSAENHVLYDSLRRGGVPVVNFAGVLKHDLFPLAPLLTELLELGREGMGTEVEMEFAAVRSPGDASDELSVLQLRPLLAHQRDREVELKSIAPERPRLVTGRALGHGVVRDLRDVIYLHPDRFSMNDTPALAHEIGRLNGELSRQGRPYLLIGPGRWGTRDRWMGVPVAWGQVSAVRVFVELELPGKGIESSQGTHFFHNITSLKVGYFCLAPEREEEDRLDLEWLDSLPMVHEAGAVRHVVLPRPAVAHIDGRSGRGVILR